MKTEFPTALPPYPPTSPHPRARAHPPGKHTTATVLVREWRNVKNEAIFKMEAGTKHGFNLGEGVKGDVKGGEWDWDGTHHFVSAAYAIIYCE